MIGACDRALEILRDPTLPGPPDIELIAYVERIREETEEELNALAPQ